MNHLRGHEFVAFWMSAGLISVGIHVTGALTDAGFIDLVIISATWLVAIDVGSYLGRKAREES